MVEKSPDEIIAGIREVLTAHKILLKLNPEQNVGFVVEHLSKVFDRNESETAELEPKREEAEKTILDKVRIVYTVFKTLRRWESEEAAVILIKNMEEIFFKSREEEILMNPTKNQNQNQDQDDPCSNVDAENNFESESMSTDVILNLEPTKNDASPNQNLTSGLKQESIQQPKKLHRSSKEPTRNRKTPKRIKTNKSFFFCKFCTQWFTNFKSKESHQISCGRPFLKSRGQSESQNMTSNPNPSSSLISHTLPLKPERDSVGPKNPNAGEMTGGKTLEEKFSKIGKRIVKSPKLSSSTCCTEYDENDEKKQQGNEKLEKSAAKTNEANPNNLPLDPNPDHKTFPFDHTSSSCPKNRNVAPAATCPCPGPPKMYNCVQCNWTFHNHGHLINHARRNAREESQRNPLTCPLCDEEFHNIENRKAHEILEHSRNGRFYCQLCTAGSESGSGFATVSRLLAHTLLHF